MSDSSNTSLVLSECDGRAGSSASTETVLVAISYAVLIPLIVVGNGLVVTAFVMNQKLRTATNIFICGLGLSDLLIGVFSVPYWTYISSLNSLVDAFCTPLYHVYICIDIGTGCASILQLTSIAIERLYFTVSPLKHRRLRSSIYWYMLALAWIFSIFAAGLQPLQAKAKWNDEYSVFLLVSCFLIPLFIIIAVYAYIFKVSRDQSRRRSSTRSRIGSSGGNIKEFNMFVTVIVITGVFIIAWAPFFVTTVTANFCPKCIVRIQSDHLVRFVKWMQYSSSAINPYIYAYRNEEVRYFFKKILCGICPCNGCLDITRLKSQSSSHRTRPRQGGNINRETSKQNASEGDIESVTIPHRLPQNLDCNKTSHNENVSAKYCQRISINDSTDAQVHGIQPCFDNNGYTCRNMRLEKQHTSKDKNWQRKADHTRRFNEFERQDDWNRFSFSQKQKRRRKTEEDTQRNNLNKSKMNNELQRPQVHSCTEQRGKQRSQQEKVSANSSETDGKKHQSMGRHCDQIQWKQSYQNCGNVKRNNPHIRSFDNQVDITSEMSSTYV